MWFGGAVTVTRGDRRGGGARDRGLQIRTCMRLVVGLVGIILSASIARAQSSDQPDPPEHKPEPPRTRVPLRVVKVLPGGNQALLFNRNRGTHVLAEVGAMIEGFLVEDIDEDEVTLSANGARIVLAAPDQSWLRRRNEATPAGHSGTTAEPTPVDPYADPEPRSAQAPSFRAGDDGVRIVKAPPQFEPMSGANSTTAPATPPTSAPAAPTTAPGPVTSTVEPGATTAPATPATPATPHTSASPGPTATSPGPVTSTVEPGATAAPAPAPDAPIVLPRHEVDVALSDFARLSTALRGTFTSEGARLDVVADGSLFAKAGLHPGDIVASVDGKPLRSLDDAAELYARAQTIHAMTLHVVRGGKPLVMRLTIQ